MTIINKINSLRYAYGRCRQSGYKKMGLRRLRDAHQIYLQAPHKAGRLIEAAADILERAQKITNEELIIQAMLTR
jgi:hypothetical protein